MNIYTRIKAFIILHSNDSQDNIPYYYDKREMMKGLKMRKRKDSGTSNYTCIILMNYYVVFAMLREIDMSSWDCRDYNSPNDKNLQGIVDDPQH